MVTQPYFQQSLWKDNEARTAWVETQLKDLLRLLEERRRLHEETGG